MKRSPRLTVHHIEELATVINDGASSGREVRRAQAILMVDDQVDEPIISQVTGYQRRRIYALRRQYLDHGLAVVKDQRKGQPKELLTSQQRAEIAQLVASTNPQEHSYQNTHWTTSLLGDFIERTYKVRYKSKTSLYLIFRQAKFTYHKPGRRYHEHNQHEVDNWRAKTLPIIKKAWPVSNTVILAEDEMILTTQTTLQKIWLPQGSYPKIEVSNHRQRLHIYGFLNVKTGQEHAFKTKRQNMRVTARILKKVRQLYPDQHLLLLWDQAGWHKGSKVQQTITQDGQMSTVYFPRYAPEENPQEHVWKRGRSHVTHNQFIANINKATTNFVTYLNRTVFPYSFLGFSAVS